VCFDGVDVVSFKLNVGTGKSFAGREEVFAYIISHFNDFGIRVFGIDLTFDR